MEKNNCSEQKCGCVGYGYVPVQEMGRVYELDKAMTNGTLFPELNLDITEYGEICKGMGGMTNE